MANTGLRSKCKVVAITTFGINSKVEERKNTPMFEGWCAGEVLQSAISAEGGVKDP